jgi:hypothetical protein
MLLPRKPSTPDASSNHSHTTLLHSTAYRLPATHSSLRCRSSTANDGSSHTRWCTQVMGLTRHAVSPVTANAPVQSSAAIALRARHAHTHSTASTANAQAARLGSAGSASRASTPCNDWLET